jgi:hypothetical protein
MGGWRRLQKEELHNLYASPDIITAMKSSIMGWEVRVERMVEMRSVNIILVRKSKGRYNSVSLDVD